MKDEMREELMKDKVSLDDPDVFKCEHSFIDDNEGCYGFQICRICGYKEKK